MKPAGWPDLTVLDNYPNPHGDTCTDNGTTSSGNEPRGEKLEENHLKNRFLLPSHYTPYGVDQMLALPTHDDQTLDNTGVQFTGYVESVKYGGTEGESCNCDAKRTDELDAHIEVVADPSKETETGKGMIIVEVTERSRRLSSAGLLSTNIGNDWSTLTLRRSLEGHWVTFSGWLFYDPDHEEESWSVDPDDTEGRSNWRGSPWEVHPVLGIQLLTAKPTVH